MREKEEENVYCLPVRQTKADPFLKYSESLRKSKVPIIIDNGSYQCKVGFANQESPSFVFRNHVARHRGKKENEVQVGNDIQNIEAIRWLLKTQFDKNVVTQFDVQKSIFDYIFSHLGINAEDGVNHPIVITEALCNPTYSRQCMTELLFDHYRVPQVAYGIDALYSFFYNRGKENIDNGLVLSLGYTATHVLPVLNKKLDLQNCKRINVGGHHMINYFHRLLQLKYPVHMSSITPSRAESLLHKHLYFSQCFNDDIELWENEEYNENNVHKVQLPFTPLPSTRSDIGAGKLEKCYTILKQVQALKIKRRVGKLALDEERLNELTSVQEMLDDEDDEAILALQELGYSSASELHAGIKQLNCSIQKMKAMIAAQHGQELEDSPLKWCEELDLCKFNDAEEWISAIRQKRKELLDIHIKAPFERMKSTGQSAFTSFMALDLPGGTSSTFEDPETYKEYVSEMEERREHIEILDEILTDYNRELSKPEKSFSFNMAEYYQLHLGVERIRVPEIIFQPSLLGIEQAGLAETIEMVLAMYNPIQQQLLAENVFITGGCASLPFIKERIEAELLAVRPFQSKFHVSLAKNSALDGWKGAKQWAQVKDNLSNFFVTRSAYEEKGSDYFKEHSYSNVFVPAPPVYKKGAATSDNNSLFKTEQRT